MRLFCNFKSLKILLLLFSILFILFFTGSKKLDATLQNISSPNPTMVFNDLNQPKFVLSTKNQIKSQTLVSAKKQLIIDSAKIKAELFHGNKITSVEPEIASVPNSDKFEINLKNLNIKPGKYTLKVDIEKSSQIQRFEQDFNWGVLALNLDQSTYKPLERASLGIGVLDDLGRTVCNASILLNIIDPEGKLTELSTDTRTISASETCANGNTTNVPDYQAFYTPLATGKYLVKLRAEIENGTRELSESFEVIESPDYVIKRFDTSMRIYPLAKYKVNIQINSKENINGVIKERVPKSFAIEDISDNGIFKSEKDENIIIWHLGLEEKTKTVSYIYDAPDISPEFYLLGPLEIFDSYGFKKQFTEPRPWQIASDAIPTYVGAGSAAGNTVAITPGLPSSLAANDILLLFVETANQVVTITANGSCSSWTQASGSPQGTGTAAATDATRIAAYWCRYGGSGTTGPTVGDSGNHQLARIIAIRGVVDSGDPIDITSGSVEAGNIDNSGVIPGATTTDINRFVVTAVATALPDANGTAGFSSWANSDLAGLEEKTDNTTNAGNGGGLGLAAGEKAIPGTYGNTTVTTSSSTAKAYMTIALKGKNFSPNLIIDDPSIDTDVADGSAYTVQYDLTDDEDAALVDFYYETDGNGTGGSAISACQDQAEGTNATCQFYPLTEGMSPSTYYYIYGLATDGINTDVIVVSSGRIRVNDAPVFEVTEPDGIDDSVYEGSNYTIYYNLNDTDSVVTVDLYYDTNNSGLDGTQISNCQNSGEGNSQTCVWDTTGISVGDYYIYGKDINDSVNSEVTAYSSGYVTITSGNTSPNSPSSLTQKKVTGGTVLDVGDWSNENQVQFTATASDPDSSDTLYLCVEKDTIATSFSSTDGGDLCGTGVAYSGTPVEVTVTITSLADASEFHWQAQVKDATNAYSSFVSYGANTENPPTNPAARDFGIDTTAPTSGVVYDGLSGDQDYNDGSLDTLSTNYSFDSGASGVNYYEYAVIRSLDSYFWNSSLSQWQLDSIFYNNGTDTTATVDPIYLNTSDHYYFSVKAVDNAENTSLEFYSNGQRVSPTISFSFLHTSILFSNLNNSNNWTDTKTNTITTSTNAYNGYTVKSYLLQPLTSLSYPLQTISNFYGSWNTPQLWPLGTYGFGYTSSDTDVGGSNRFGSETKYAALHDQPPGDIIADHTENITGQTGDISNQSFTVTYKVAVGQDQAASSYQTHVVYLVTANY